MTFLIKLLYNDEMSSRSSYSIVIFNFFKKIVYVVFFVTMDRIKFGYFLKLLYFSDLVHMDNVLLKERNICI